MGERRRSGESEGSWVRPLRSQRGRGERLRRAHGLRVPQPYVRSSSATCATIGAHVGGGEVNRYATKPEANTKINKKKAIGN